MVAQSSFSGHFLILPVPWPGADNVTVVVIDLGGGKDGWANGKGKGKGGGGMTGGWPFGN